MNQCGSQNSRLISKTDEIIEENEKLVVDVRKLIQEIKYNLLSDDEKESYLFQLARESFNLRLMFNKLLSEKYVLSSYLDMNISKLLIGRKDMKFIPFDVQKNFVISQNNELRLVKDKIIKLESQLKLISELDKKVSWLCSILKGANYENRRN